VPAGIYNIKVVGNNLNETFNIVIGDGEDVFIDLYKKYPK
jgi:hypothetical protein